MKKPQKSSSKAPKSCRASLVSLVSPCVTLWVSPQVTPTYGSLAR